MGIRYFRSFFTNVNLLSGNFMSDNLTNFSNNTKWYVRKIMIHLNNYYFDNWIVYEKLKGTKKYMKYGSSFYHRKWWLLPVKIESILWNLQVLIRFHLLCLGFFERNSCQYTVNSLVKQRSTKNSGKC